MNRCISDGHAICDEGRVARIRQLVERYRLSVAMIVSEIRTRALECEEVVGVVATVSAAGVV